MGASESLPNPDARTLKSVEQAGLTTQELRVFWRHFRRGDPHLRGVMSVDTFFTLFNETRSIFGDSLFEIIEVSVNDDIDFGKYLAAVVTYCLFEPAEILRFCFYVLDRDKNGYIEKDDLILLLRVLYTIVPPAELGGNIRNALQKIEFHADGKVDFREFKRVHRHFPALLYPAFRLQYNFMVYTMGYKWWDRTKMRLHDDKVRSHLIETKPERLERKRVMTLREKRVRKKMGILRYICCSEQRAVYRALFPIKNTQTQDGAHAHQNHDEQQRRRALERKARQIAARNPENAVWQKYLARHKGTLLLQSGDSPAEGTSIDVADALSMPHRKRTPAQVRAHKAQVRRADKIAAARSG